jgi:hypothetical protein
MLAMIVLDALLVGGLKFVLSKIAAAVDAELNDDTALRERLLEAQMRLELGELSEEEFVALERDVLARLREIRERRGGGATMPSPDEFRVTGIEAEFAGEEHADGEGSPR